MSDSAYPPDWEVPPDVQDDPPPIEYPEEVPPYGQPDPPIGGDPGGPGDYGGGGDDFPAPIPAGVAGGDWKKLLLWGGLAIGGLYLWQKYLSKMNTFKKGR